MKTELMSSSEIQTEFQNGQTLIVVVKIGYFSRLKNAQNRSILISPKNDQNVRTGIKVI